MRSQSLREGAFVGDVRQGGTCNAEILELSPHCHGTHTECIGHILEERVSVLDTIDCTPGLALLLTVSGDAGYISREQLEQAMAEKAGDHTALILRTLPNPLTKQWRDYSLEPDFPVLDGPALAWLSALPLRHLLLDTPSLDAQHNRDLTNHRSWWGQNPGIVHYGFSPRHRSVTEMVYVPNEIPDGEYWLHLELSPIVSDATPSRPVIYPVSEGAHNR